MIGISGVGKSTISNCLFNQKGDMGSLKKPFKTSDGAGSCTLKFEMRSNQQYNIIDSIGFASPDMNASYILDEMRGALKQVNNEIDYVFYVIEKGRLTNTTFHFINKCQKEVFQNKARNNSVLIVNMCEKGWLQKDAQRTNEYWEKILDSVNGQAYELDLKWDHWRDSYSTKLTNIEIRQKSIHEFVHFVDNLQMNKIKNSVLYNCYQVKHQTEGVFSILNEIIIGIKIGLFGRSDGYNFGF